MDLPDKVLLTFKISARLDRIHEPQQESVISGVFIAVGVTTTKTEIIWKGGWEKGVSED